MYSVDMLSVISVVQTHCTHLSSPSLSHLPLLHKISTAIFPCQGLILPFFLCARTPICPFWQGMHAPSLPRSLPAPHTLHCLLPHHTEGRFPQLPSWGLCLSPTCHFCSLYSVFSQTSFLLPTNPIVVHFPLPFSPSPLIVSKGMFLIIDKNILWYFWMN